MVVFALTGTMREGITLSLTGLPATDPALEGATDEHCDIARGESGIISPGPSSHSEDSVVDNDMILSFFICRRFARDLAVDNLFETPIWKSASVGGP